MTNIFLARRIRSTLHAPRLSSFLWFWFLSDFCPRRLCLHGQYCLLWRDDSLITSLVYLTIIPDRQRRSIFLVTFSFRLRRPTGSRCSGNVRACGRGHCLHAGGIHWWPSRLAPCVGSTHNFRAVDTSYLATGADTFRDRSTGLAG